MTWQFSSIYMSRLFQNIVYKFIKEIYVYWRNSRNIEHDMTILQYICERRSEISLVVLLICQRCFNWFGSWWFLCYFIMMVTIAVIIISILWLGWNLRLVNLSPSLDIHIEDGTEIWFDLTQDEGVKSLRQFPYFLIASSDIVFALNEQCPS